MDNLDTGDKGSQMERVVFDNTGLAVLAYTGKVLHRMGKVYTYWELDLDNYIYSIEG